MTKAPTEAERIRQELEAARARLAELREDRPQVKRMRDAARAEVEELRGKRNADARAEAVNRAAGLDGALHQHDRDLAAAQADVTELEAQRDEAEKVERQAAAWARYEQRVPKLHDQLADALDTIRRVHGEYRAVRDDLSRNDIFRRHHGHVFNQYNREDVHLIDDTYLFNAARDAAVRMGHRLGRESDLYRNEGWRIPPSGA